MQHATQIALAKHLFDLHDTRTTDLANDVYRQPVTDYFDATTAQSELAKLFREHPLLLCLSCELKNPGDYVCDDFSGVPIIAIRTTSGNVSAFLNIPPPQCPARLRSRGRSKAITVPLSRLDLRIRHRRTMLNPIRTRICGC